MKFETWKTLVPYRDLGLQARLFGLLRSHVEGERIWVKGVHQPSFILGLYNYSQAGLRIAPLAVGLTSILLSLVLHRLIFLNTTVHYQKVCIIRPSLGSLLPSFPAIKLLRKSVCLLCYFQAVDSRWNMHGLGWYQFLQRGNLSTAAVLHWTGRSKPWLGELGFYKPLWLPYSLECQQ